MRQFILLAFTLFGCSTSKQIPREMILGSWVFVTAQNDKASIAEFDKTMEGKILTFYKDGTLRKSATV